MIAIFGIGAVYRVSPVFRYRALALVWMKLILRREHMDVNPICDFGYGIFLASVFRIHHDNGVGFCWCRPIIYGLPPTIRRRDLAIILF